MKIHCAPLLCCLCASVPLVAQTQIGGGTCSSSSLTGTYSLTLTGRDVGASVAFTKVLQGIGTAVFDGQNKVTFSLTNNSNQTAGASQTLTGTYTLQANCVGALNITAGDTATFTLESYNTVNTGTSYLSRDFLITGQDGTYAFTGSGNLLPATCSAGIPAGTYSFNASGFALAANAVAGVNNISGLLQFDGKGAVTTTLYLAANGSSTQSTVTGTYTAAPNCTATATGTDGAGNAYTLTFTVTAANGSNFVFSGANSKQIFSGSGRIL